MRAKRQPADPEDRQTRRTTCQRLCLHCPLLGVGSFKRQNGCTTSFICLSHYPSPCQNVSTTIGSLDRGMGWSNERILQNVPDKKPEIRRLRSLWKERERASQKEAKFPCLTSLSCQARKGPCDRHRHKGGRKEGKGLKASFDCFIMIWERSYYK